MHMHLQVNQNDGHSKYEVTWQQWHSDKEEYLPERRGDFGVKEESWKSSVPKVAYWVADQRRHGRAQGVEGGSSTSLLRIWKHEASIGRGQGKAERRPAEIEMKEERGP